MQAKQLFTKQIVSVLIGAVVLSGMVGFVPAVSMASPEQRVAFVDLKRALAESKAGKKAQKEYEKEVIEAQAELDQKKGELEKLQKAFIKQKDSLKRDALVGKEEKLISMEKDLKRSFSDTQEQLRRRNAQLVAELIERLKVVVDQIGEKESYTVILERGAQSVLYADSSIDVTDKVIEVFDKNN